MFGQYSARHTKPRQIINKAVSMHEDATNAGGARDQRVSCVSDCGRLLGLRPTSGRQTKL